MGWALKGTPKTVRVTNKLAKEWAEMEASHIERPLSERRLQVYQRVLEAGGFRPVTWAKVFCKETGQSYRVNGQHTATVFSGAEMKAGQEVYATVEEYEAETLEDVSRLFATFDSRSQTRTVGDINRSFAAAIPELAGMADRMINLAVGALGFNTWPGTEGGFAGKTYKGPAERAELLFDNTEVVLWLGGMIGQKEAHRHLWRVPVAAAMIGTYQKNKSDAGRFWTAVREDTGDSPDLPDRRLSRWLLTMNMDKGIGARVATRYKAEPREFYVRCISAWNLWRGGKTSELRYYVNSEIPAIK